MIALDTNVLLRALVDDPSAPRQCSVARELIANTGNVRISSIVLMEALWVLVRTYRAPRREVTRIATMLLDHPLYRIGDSDLLRAALEIFSRESIDFSDAVALADAGTQACTLYTFDRRLAKLEGAVLPGTP